MNNEPQTLAAPRTGASAVRNETTGRPAPVSGDSKNLRILVVEDERIVARDLQATLREAGYQVPAMAASAEEAIALAASLKPDLVLMDIVLQGDLDGVAAAERIRRQFGIPVIYLTSSGSGSIFQRAMATEPIAYILKPYEEKDLLTTVEVAFHQYHASQQRAITALLACEKRFRTVFEMERLAIGLVSRDGRFVDSNRALQQLVGCGAGELRHTRFSDLAHPEDEGEEEMLFQELLAGGRDSYQIQKRERDKDGRERWVRLSVSLFPGEEDEAWQFALRLVEDITEQKRLERQVVQAQRMESLGALASGLAHDLSNTLSPLSLIIPLLRESATKDADIQMLTVVEASLGQSTHLLKQLLSFVRSTPGERVLLEPQRLLNEIGGIIHHTFSRSIYSTVSCAGGLWPVKGNATQLYQAILNLCINARDAMPEGGQLLLSARNMRMDETLAAEHPGAKAGAYVLLTVTDTGAGIAPENLSKIFSLFFTTKPPGKGTGLGLSTTRDIVKDHGGFLEVSTEVGKGTIFTVFLPAAG